MLYSERQPPEKIFDHSSRDFTFFPESTLILIISFSEDKTSLVFFLCDFCFAEFFTSSSLL